MRKLKIHLARAEIVTDRQRAAFIGCVAILTDVGFLVFDGWTQESWDTHDGTTLFEVANFTQPEEVDPRPTEQFLRGVAYAVTQLVV